MIMKVMTCLAAIVLAFSSFAAVAADSTGAAPTNHPNTSGNLPKDSLVKERAGALGENPEPVTQKGASGDQAGKAVTPTAGLPDGSLVEKRKGTIGTPPEPVVQGGGADAAKNQ
jgi:hypothetical protein